MSFSFPAQSGKGFTRQSFQIQQTLVY